LGSLNIITAGTDSHAISALNSNITVGNNININTTNDRSKGILSEENSVINVGSNINIYTDGQDSIGINTLGTGSDYAIQTSRATVNAGDNIIIRTTGSDTYPTQSRSDGIAAKYGDIVVGNNIDILTTGIGSYGVRADYESTINIGDNLSVVTTGQHGQSSTTGSGWWSYGIVSTKGSDIVIGDNLFVNIKGNNTLGVEAQTYWATRGFGVSTITIGNNAYIKTEGNDISVALWASDGGIINIGHNATVITTGGTNKGPTNAVAANGRYGTAPVNGEWLIPVINMGDNATILTTGGYSHGVYSYYGNVTIGDNAKIITTGNRSNGVYSWGSGSTGSAESSYGGSNVIIGDNAFISTSGSADLGGGSGAAYGSNAANALYARQNGNITLGNNATLSVSGDQASVIYMYDYGSASAQLHLLTGIIFEGTSTLNANGNNTKIFNIAFSNGTVDFNGETTLNTLGDNINVFAVSGNGNDKYNANVSFNDSLNINAYGSNSKAIYLDNGYAYDFNALNVSVYGSNSHALYIAGGSNLTLDDKTSLNAFNNSSYALYSNGGIVVNTDTLNIFGNILSDNGGDISLDFNSASSFTGSASLANNGVVNLSFDNSKWNILQNSTLSSLQLSNGAAVDFNSSSFLTLRTDNLIGSTGIFGIKIDAENILSDKVIISNSSSGSYNVKFDDRTTGGYTANNFSVPIIENINPSGDYHANFSGQVELGSYIYSLTWDNNTNIYYIGDITPSGGNNSGGVTPPSIPTPQTSSANTSAGFAMINYAINRINTQNILKRMGELRDGGKDGNGDMWARTYIGKLSSFDDKMQIDGTGYYGLQIGLDKAALINNARLYTGLSAGYLKADTDYKKGESESKLYNLGIYALYKNDSGFYMDAVIKYIQNKNNFNTVTINNMSVNGNGDSQGFSLSAEIGKRYGLANNFYIEPQAEFTYTKHGELSVKSSNGLKTEIDGFNSYLARGSVIAGYKLKDTISVYAKTGYTRELDGKMSYMFNGDQSTKKESYTPNKNRFDNAVGVTVNNINHNLYIEGIYEKGSEFDNIAVDIGYRYSF
jgi:outer membrane autotransporter protein